jgi:hypothetical protein
MMTKFLTFPTSYRLKQFLERKITPMVLNDIEYAILEKFRFNRILFTAEHAVVKKIELKEFGKNAYITIGEKNTDLLAKLAAFHIRSAYIFPLFSRLDADASRNPNDIGKGLTLLTRIWKSKKQKRTRVLIHSNPAFLPHLNRYHKIIERLNPKAVISIHGMNIKRKFDVLFGFAENYSAIGGKDLAFQFKYSLLNFLEDVFHKLKLGPPPKIAISTWLLTGSKNYVLSKHVVEYNKLSNENRIGMQVEFNWRGRVDKKDWDKPSIRYQVFIQALANFVFRWLYGDQIV